MDVSTTDPTRATTPARVALNAGAELAANLDRLHALAGTVLDTHGKTSAAERLQAYKTLQGMGAAGRLQGMSRADADLFQQATGGSSIGQKAVQLQRSYLAATDSGAQAGGAAAAIKAGLSHFDGLAAADQETLFQTGINAPDRTAARPFSNVQGWRDNMTAQLKMVSYMQESGAVGANGVLDRSVAAKKSVDPKFAAALDLSLDRNNNSAGWTAKVLQLFGGAGPADKVDLSDAARQILNGLPNSTSPPPIEPYRQGSLVSRTA